MSRSSALTVLLLGLVALTSSGCRSFQGSFRNREVAQLPSDRIDKPDPAEIVRTVAHDHERRAQLVQSLKVAELNIRIANYRDQRGRERSPFVGAAAGGVLVIERPRNLRVKLSKPPGMAVADIGSNDQEFWFANDLQNEMVVGNYEQTEGFADPMLASIRPDWIFEVLGLEPLPADLEIVPGESDATITLVEQRRLANGSSMVKESVVSVAEQRIIEHRLYTEGRRELIAKARVEKPETIRLPSNGSDEPPVTIQLPRIVHLTVPEMAELTMYLGGIKPNPNDDFVANTTFDLPPKEGYDVVNILQLSGANGAKLADHSQEPAQDLSRQPERSVTAAAPSRSATTRGASSDDRAPGALSLPRSDREVARTEELSTRGGRPEVSGSGFQSIADRSPVSPDLPSPNRPGRAESGVEVRRQSWQASGSRFPRGVLGRE